MGHETRQNLFKACMRPFCQFITDTVPQGHL